jgi:hypothetical protein
MGDLKPLGSEKLQGMDKIQRIIELSKFRENVPSSINETSKGEYSLTLADGNEYQIVREKSGYIIKQTISESETDYLTPIQDRKYFNSYSQALKKLNLMAKEMNELHDNREGVSLFSEQKKFVLKTPNTEKKNTNPTEDVENVPAPPTEPSLPSLPPSPPVEGSDVPPPPMDDMDMSEPPMDDMDMGSDEGTTEPVGDDKDEVVTFKLIQKLTGKLGQKLRTLNSDEENQMSSKDIKYVINSILSALDLNNLDEDDREDIMNKFEGVEADGEMESDEFDTGEEFGSEEETPSEDMGTEEPLGFGEVGETWGDLAHEIAGKTLMKGMTPGEFSEEEDEFNHVGKIADSIFMEAKIENVLMKYFNINESEKKFNDEVRKQRIVETKSKISKRNSEIKRLSENIEQEIASRKFIKENKTANLVGKTNKKNLVFEINKKQYKITPNGQVL